MDKTSANALGGPPTQGRCEVGLWNPLRLAERDCMAPKQAPTLAAQLVERLKMVLVLKSLRYKGHKRLAVELLDDGRRIQKVWLSNMASERVNEIVEALIVDHGDISAELRCRHLHQQACPPHGALLCACVVVGDAYRQPCTCMLCGRLQWPVSAVLLLLLLHVKPSRR